jgi:hypothetical protein
MRAPNKRPAGEPAVVIALLLAFAAPGTLRASGSAGDGGSGGGEFAGGPAALQAVQQRLGGPVKVLSVAVYPDAVDIEAQDPAQPTHVDRYHYAEGRLEGPEPVAVGRNRRQLEARLFPLAAADLERLRLLLPEALVAVAAEDGRVQHVTLERSEYEGWNDTSTSWTRPLFRVHVTGPRSGGYAEFRLDGKRGRVVCW